MAIQVFVVCATCRNALTLEWDPASFLVDDPLGGQQIIEGEIAEPSLLYGTWPKPDSQPIPIAAGAWAALSTQAMAFVRRHFAHPDFMGLFLTREPPPGVRLINTQPFAFPARSGSDPSPDSIPAQEIGSIPISERLETAAQFDPLILWNKVTGPESGIFDGLLLTGWMPPDPQIDERLLALVIDTDRGALAEQALAVRILLGTNDPGIRRQRLLEVAQAAYTRQTLSWGRVSITPYDKAAPVSQLQAGLVRHLTAAGHLEKACDFAVRLKLYEDSLGMLRETLADRILDSAAPADMRLRFVGHANRIFTGLVGELRLERGLACDPMPSQQAWSALGDSARAMTALTVAPENMRRALASADVSEVITALEILWRLDFISPRDAAPFEPDVRALCRDSRTEPGPVGTRLCARARDVHSRLFAALDGVGAWNSLNEVIEAMLTAGLGVSLGMHFRALGANRIPVERVGALLVQRVADRSRPVKERLQAREALSMLAIEAAATRRNEPRPSPEGQAAARQADDFLIAALNDPDEPKEFTSAIRSSLTRWMPDRIAALQGTVIERIPAPSITTLIPGQSIAGIDKNEVLALLRDPGADIGRLLGAIALAEPFIRMSPELAVEFEPLLRARIADVRRFSDRGRILTVALEAWFAHRSIWERLKAEQRPRVADLITALYQTAAAQDSPAPGERSYAACLAETVCPCLQPADETAIAEGLEPMITDRRSRAWTRLHVYHALSRLRNQGGRADKALFTAIADSGEDPELRSEAHALLAPRMPQPVFDLQLRGLLPCPPIPPVETLFHNVPMYERDTDGEWLLTPDAFQLGNLVCPDDLITALRDAAWNPSRACAAAALAALVAKRLPPFTGRIVEALQSGRNSDVEIHAVIEGRPRTFRLADLCVEALRGIGC